MTSKYLPYQPANINMLSRSPCILLCVRTKPCLVQKINVAVFCGIYNVNANALLYSCDMWVETIAIIVHAHSTLQVVQLLPTNVL